jgi:hypothetical protein
MSDGIDSFTYVSLALAMTAAIMSAPEVADQTSRTSDWLISRLAPQADALAAALAEHPEVIIPP